jgi:arginyl-tRNA synthetase
VGDAIVRILAYLGHDVIRANHLGDWGTQFGLLIEHLLDVGEDTARQQLSAGEINAFYQAARVKFDSDPAFADRSRHRVVLLQGGDRRPSACGRRLSTIPSSTTTRSTGGSGSPSPMMTWHRRAFTTRCSPASATNSPPTASR